MVESKEKQLYCLDMIENNDMDYTLLDRQINVANFEIELIKSLKIQGYKMPCSERNDSPITQFGNYLKVNSYEYFEDECEGFVFWDESLDFF